jgi:AraC-like DNA-binding protein
MKIQKYHDSHITPKELHRIWWQLHDHLESNSELWLRPTSLKEFCHLLKTNQKYFSQTVNQATGFSINTLIHTYRLEAFLEKIQNGEAQIKTIEGLQLEVGFNNRSSFYSAFRKMMGGKVTDFITQVEVENN